METITNQNLNGVSKVNKDKVNKEDQNGVNKVNKGKVNKEDQSGVSKIKVRREDKNGRMYTKIKVNKSQSKLGIQFINQMLFSLTSKHQIVEKMYHKLPDSTEAHERSYIYFTLFYFNNYQKQ